MVRVDLTESKVMSRGSQIGKIYHKNSVAYNYEVRDVQVGDLITTQPSTTTVNSSSLNRWQSYTVYGRTGSSKIMENAYFINDKRVGAGFNRRTVVITSPVNHTHYRGTKSDSTHYEYPVSSVTYLSATTEYRTRARINFSNAFTDGKEVVIAFRTNSSVSNISGRIRYKVNGQSTVVGFDFTISGNSSNVDENGRRLFTLINAPDMSGGAGYGGFIEVFINQSVSSLYDVSMFVSRASTAPERVPVYYTVKSGDTLWAISQSYGMTVYELYALNGRSEEWPIYPGSLVIVGYR